MFAQIRRFRGLYKPPGLPRLVALPRGLRVCAPLAEPSWAQVGPWGGTFPANRGTLPVGALTAFGYGIRFDGSTSSNNEISYVAENTANVSVEFLFYTGATVTNMSIGGFNDSPLGTSNTNDKNFSIDGSTNLTWYIFDGGAKTAGIGGITANTLYHIVGTCDGTTMRLYVNGAQAASTAAGASFTGYTTPSFCIGSINASTGGIFPSNITVLYGAYANVPWTAVEVAARYADVFGSLIYPEDDIFATLGGNTKVVFYKTTGNITLPADFNTASNTIECLGESGAAASGTTLIAGGGAGAGAYAKISNYSANGQNATVAVTVGTGGTAVKTIFDTGNSSCIADFGTSASGATAGAGGLTTNSTGTTKFAGGNGGNGATSAGGSGGGAAGPAGAGGNAAASSTITSGNGGTANNGSVAGGTGVGTTNPGNPGVAQTPAVWVQTSNSEGASPSSGASGAGGASLTAEAGGAAVAYGGAPGGGDIVATGTSTAGAPAAGLIVLTYQPIAPVSPLFFAAFYDYRPPSIEMQAY